MFFTFSNSKNIYITGKVIVRSLPFQSVALAYVLLEAGVKILLRLHNKHILNQEYFMSSPYSPKSAFNTVHTRPFEVARIFKWLIPTATLAIALTASSAVVAQDLYLVVGQSNAAGRDTDIRSTRADSPDNSVLLFNNGNSFEVAEQPLNRYSNIRNVSQDLGVNMGLEFGIRMHERTGRTINLVVNARGGTRIGQWRRGEELFTDTATRVRDAQSACNCTLTGIVWHHGEANINSEENSFTSSYFNSLALLINEFRAEFGPIPFIVGEVERNRSNRSFNFEIRKVDNSSFGVPNVEWARSEKLDTIDGTHFNAASMRAFGRRYANRMLEFIN